MAMECICVLYLLRSAGSEVTFHSYVPLQPEVLMKFRKNSYIQLRSYARSLDNPVVRGDAFPILFLAVSLYKEALRCAITIEGYPYPYDKWLVPVAQQTVVGRKILECAGDFGVILERMNPLLPCTRRTIILSKWKNNFERYFWRNSACEGSMNLG